MWTSFVRSILKHPFQILLLAVATVFTKSWKWQCANQQHSTHESEFKMFSFFVMSRFILWLILPSEGCVKSSLWSYLRSVLKYVFHFRSLFRLLANHPRIQGDSPLTSLTPRFLISFFKCFIRKVNYVDYISLFYDLFFSVSTRSLLNLQVIQMLLFCSL